MSRQMKQSSYKLLTNDRILVESKNTRTIMKSNH